MSTQAMKHKVTEEHQLELLTNNGNESNGNKNAEEEPIAKKVKLENGGAKQPLTTTTNFPPTVIVENIEAEAKVGMTILINKNRFQGIIKQRFSDFMVREIDPNGKKIVLNDTNHIDDQKPSNNTEEPTTKEPDLSCPLEDVDLAKRIDDFAKNESEETLTDQITFVNNDKENRKACHMYFKLKYPNLETDVLNKEDDTREFIIYYKKSKKSDPRARKNKSTPHGQFCHFVLHKQNKDTMDTINLLSKKLRITSKVFSYAGTKDRRATTIQRVALKLTPSKRLKDLNKSLINIVLGNFEYKSEPLKLGDLSGNEFTLVIRDVSNATESQVIEACQSLKENGFINYFGLQRFGTGGAGTHDVGRALLKDDFEKACNLILAVPLENDNDRSKERTALKIWSNNKDAQKAFSALRNRNGIEGKLLSSLKNSPKDFLGALNRLPRNMRLLYLHSYQSLIWNKAVSYRLEKYGFIPVVGDLVLTAETDDEGHRKARLLTQDDITSNAYTIENIVLPMPGYDVIYPNTSCYEYMKTLMEKDGLDITNMRRAQKDNSLAGAYRTFLVKPKETSWQLIRYDDFTISLIENDVERMEKVVENATTKSRKSETAECKRSEEGKTSEDTGVVVVDNDVEKSTGPGSPETKNSIKTSDENMNCGDGEKTKMDTIEDSNETLGVKDGKYLALKLSFQLPPSCYATTALRELLTSDSSYKAQQQLNANFNRKRK